MRNKLELRKIDCIFFFHQACNHWQVLFVLKFGIARDPLELCQFFHIKSKIYKSIISSKFFMEFKIVTQNLPY